MTEPVRLTYPGATVDTLLETVNGSNLSATHKITRSATLVIAASNSSAKGKAQADYVCTGTADNTIIQAALDALPATGGEIHLLEGTYQLAATVTRAIDNVLWSGCGLSTYLKWDNVNTLISGSTQTGWTIKDMRLDYGGFILEDGTKWSVENIWVNGKAKLGVENTIHIDKWSDEHKGAYAEHKVDPCLAFHPLIEKLDDFTTGWYTPNESATVSVDTSVTKNAAASTKFITPVGANAYILKTMTVPDLTDAGLSFWIYTPDYTKIRSIQTSFQFNGVWNTDYYRDDTNYTTIPAMNNRWIQFTIPWLDKHGNATPDNLTQIKISVNPVSGQQATVYFADFVYWKNKVLTPRGAVTFTFDDGCDSIYLLAKPKMDTYGYKGNWAMVLDRLNWNSNTKTWMRQMQSEGWDIINHSVSHASDQIANRPKYQYGIMQKWLAENGFANGSRFASFCFGDYSAKQLDFTESHLEFCMTTMQGMNAVPGISHLTRTRPFQFGVLVSDVKLYIDQARANGTVVNFLVHDLVANATGVQTEPADFNEVIDYIAASGIEVLTYSQIAKRITDTNLSTSGTGTITNGTTSVNIRHGFHKAPKSIQVTQTSSLGSAASLWVSSKDTGTGNLFTVSVNADPGQDVTFEWVAVL